MAYSESHFNNKGNFTRATTGSDMGFSLFLHARKTVGGPYISALILTGTVGAISTREYANHMENNQARCGTSQYQFTGFDLNESNFYFLYQTIILEG